VRGLAAKNVGKAWRKHAEETPGSEADPYVTYPVYDDGVWRQTRTLRSGRDEGKPLNTDRPGRKCGMMRRRGPSDTARRPNVVLGSRAQGAAACRSALMPSHASSRLSPMLLRMTEPRILDQRHVVVGHLPSVIAAVEAHQRHRPHIGPRPQGADLL
jgi:hypothetical protein